MRKPTKLLSWRTGAIRVWLVATILLVGVSSLVKCQLPDDIQRELNQNLAEQARIQAMRAQHQQQIKNRMAGSGGAKPATGTGHDPNNYSYQQVSPPIQYSYYQPFGDAAKTPEQSVGGGQTSQASNKGPPINFDLNNMNFDMPTPQAQVSGQLQPRQMTPSFTGVGGLPIMKPVSASAGQVPQGNTPLAPQAQVQQGPPLTEADFRDITGGENYGAPGGNEFGMSPTSSSSPNARSSGDADTDSQLREFGMPDSGNGRASSPEPQQGLDQQQQVNMADFGPFGSMAGMGAPARRSQPNMGDSFGFGNLDGSGESGSSPGSTGNEFDFTGQPSSNRADQTQASSGGGAPGSLQSLLGSSFPGLGGGASPDLGGFDGFGQSAEPRQPARGQARTDDTTLGMANLGQDNQDQMSGGFDQPGSGGEQDFNFAAASNQQPSSVPYPDGAPQPVGTLLALTQPQTLTQARYNPLPDKGTYQDYPAYAESGHELTVREVVDATPRARAPGIGRYGAPSARALAPEYRPPVGHKFDYSNSLVFGENEQENY